MPGSGILVRFASALGIVLSPAMATVLVLFGIGGALLWYRASLVAEGRSIERARCDADTLRRELASARAEAEALKFNLEVIAAAADLDRALLGQLRERIAQREKEIQDHEQKQKLAAACRATPADADLDRRLRERRLAK